jgi:hypothetical protein
MYLKCVTGNIVYAGSLVSVLMYISGMISKNVRSIIRFLDLQKKTHIGHKNW